jgi:hypothetical protein
VIGGGEGDNTYMIGAGSGATAIVEKNGRNTIVLPQGASPAGISAYSPNASFDIAFYDGSVYNLFETGEGCMERQCNYYWL